MAHAYQLYGANPDGVSVAQIKEQVADALAPYERTLPAQDIAIQAVRPDPLTDRPEHLRAVYRFDGSKHARSDITAVAVDLVESLPIAWGIVEYHQCPHDIDGTPDNCPDWTREATIGDPPEAIQ